MPSSQNILRNYFSTFCLSLDTRGVKIFQSLAGIKLKNKIAKVTFCKYIWSLQVILGNHLALGLSFMDHAFPKRLITFAPSSYVSLNKDLSH